MISLFGKKDKKLAGWMSIILTDAGLRAAHIKPAQQGMPSVEWVAYYPNVTSGAEKPLEKLAKELHTDRYACTTLLNASEYRLLSVEAPTVPREELKTAIRWRLKDMLDFHVDDATIDVLDVPIDKNAPVRARSMYAVAARNQVIEQRQAVFDSAQIALRVIDIPDLAQRNISALLEPEGCGLALLSFDAEGGLLTVTYNGELYLSRRIEVTREQLMESSGVQQTAYFDKITLELQRSLDYFDRQYHYITLSKLLLAPLGEDGSSLHEYLVDNLYIPIESFGLEDFLDIEKTPELKSPAMQQHYFFTLGAALRVEETVL